MLGNYTCFFFFPFIFLHTSGFKKQCYWLQFEIQIQDINFLNVCIKYKIIIIVNEDGNYCLWVYDIGMPTDKIYF